MNLKLGRKPLEIHSSPTPAMSVALGILAILRSGRVPGGAGEKRGPAVAAVAAAAAEAVVMEMAGVEEHLPAFLIQLVAESQGTLLARLKSRGIEVFMSPLQSQLKEY